MICLECGKEFKQVTNSHLKTHKLTCSEYELKYPTEVIKFGNAISGKGKPAWNTGKTKNTDIRIHGGRKRIYPDTFCKICGNKKGFYDQFCSKECYGKARRLKISPVYGSFAKGHTSSKKGKTYEMLYGEAANEIKFRLSNSHIGIPNNRKGVPNTAEMNNKVSLGVKKFNIWERKKDVSINIDSYCTNYNCIYYSTLTHIT